MATYQHTQSVPSRVWVALIATFIAFIVALVASLNLYLLEDANPLTQAAYTVSPLLRFSYDCIYLSALSAGVAVCAMLGYTVLQESRAVRILWIIIALMVAAGGFGGLVGRHPVTFLTFFVIFMVLTLISFLVGRALETRMERVLGKRSAAILGSGVGASGVLLVNIVALVLHTLILNPVSHALYMQGQIAGTHWNFTLIAMALAVLTLLVCVVSLAYALR